MTTVYMDYQSVTARLKTAGFAITPSTPENDAEQLYMVALVPDGDMMATAQFTEVEQIPKGDWVTQKPDIQTLAAELREPSLVSPDVQHFAQTVIDEVTEQHDDYEWCWMVDDSSPLIRIVLIAGTRRLLGGRIQATLLYIWPVGKTCPSIFLSP